MCSRDGSTFKRWSEAFLRPGLQHERWINRNNMAAWGSVETRSDIADMPPEISIYSTEAYYSKQACRVRRMTLRLDGFVSVNAPFAGGGITSKPLIFSATGNLSEPWEADAQISKHWQARRPAHAPLARAIFVAERLRARWLPSGMLLP